MNLVMINQAAQILGLTVKTLEKLVSLGELVPIISGNKSHRKFDVDQIKLSTSKLLEVARMTEQLVDSKEAALFCGVNYLTIRRWVMMGRLKATRIGKTDFFSTNDLEALSKRTKVKDPKQTKEPKIKNPKPENIQIDRTNLANSKEAALFCGVTYQTIRRRAKAGKMLIVKIGKTDFFNIDTLQKNDIRAEDLVEEPVESSVEERFIEAQSQASFDQIVKIANQWTVDYLSENFDELRDLFSFGYCKPENLKDLYQIVKNVINSNMDQLLVSV